MKITDNAKNQLYDDLEIIMSGYVTKVEYIDGERYFYLKEKEE